MGGDTLLHAPRVTNISKTTRSTVPVGDAILFFSRRNSAVSPKGLTVYLTEECFAPASRSKAGAQGPPGRPGRSDDGAWPLLVRKISNSISVKRFFGVACEAIQPFTARRAQQATQAQNAKRTFGILQVEAPAKQPRPGGRGPPGRQGRSGEVECAWPMVVHKTTSTATSTRRAFFAQCDPAPPLVLRHTARSQTQGRPGRNGVAVEAPVLQLRGPPGPPGRSGRSAARIDQDIAVIKLQGASGQPGRPGRSFATEVAAHYLRTKTVQLLPVVTKRLQVLASDAVSYIRRVVNRVVGGPFVSYEAQELTDEQVQRTHTNLRSDAILLRVDKATTLAAVAQDRGQTNLGVKNAYVCFDREQVTTAAQKDQARRNIGIPSLESLKGEKGDQGEQGAQGAQGEQGAQGIRGT